ncbi:MAG: ASKHA domain-containing protein [Melioribacteraceae bacterium]
MKRQKIKLRIEPLGKEILVNENTPLKDIVHEFGVEFPCGGEGYCGGCKVKLLSGDVIDPEKHEELNYKLGLDENYRLSCISKLCEDITIEIPQLESIVLADNSTYNFTPREGFGIAVDLGTTTIVSQLIDLTNGSVVDVQTSRNPQTRFGSDIMSRIMHGMTEEGKEKSQTLIRDEIYNMVQSLIEKRKIDLTKIIIVGNTVMHHLFCGFDITPLGSYPFETKNNHSVELNPKELGWELNGNVKIIFVKPIASFIGSDILAGVLASGMNENLHLTALVDLGTNGEIVVGNNEKIVCASTAAGPAFEGTNIKMGMSAMTGAISSVNYENNKVDFHVIGNQDALGICGSGLIDATMVFLQNESIDYGGAIITENEKLAIGSRVYMTQKDIREFQLAKAAIAAGMQILVNKLGKNLSDITRVYIAGGFGNFLNLENVTKLGMLEVDEYKIKKLGNSALIGAKMLLFYDDYSFEEILNKVEHVSLDADPSFQDIFVDKMFFENYGGVETK